MKGQEGPSAGWKMPNAAAAAKTHNYCNISSFVIVKWEAGAYLEIMGDLESFLSPQAPPGCCY